MFPHSNRKLFDIFRRSHRPFSVTRPRIGRFIGLEMGLVGGGTCDVSCPESAWRSLRVAISKNDHLADKTDVREDTVFHDLL